MIKLGRNKLPPCSIEYVLVVSDGVEILLCDSDSVKIYVMISLASPSIPSIYTHMLNQASQFYSPYHNAINNNKIRNHSGTEALSLSRT
jgi:hypothetical protein